MIEDDEWRLALRDLAAGRGAPAVRHRESVALADRLVALATEGEGGRLASLLRPDPRAKAHRWRVRQFRLGDIAPTSITDHTDAAEAVLALARPQRDALVAGELLALAMDGSGWVALSRNEEEVVVQPPAPDSLLGPGGSPDGFGPLLARWRVALELSPGDLPPGDAIAADDDAAGRAADATGADEGAADGSDAGTAGPSGTADDATGEGGRSGRRRRRTSGAAADAGEDVDPATGLPAPSVDRLAAALSSLEGVVGRLAPTGTPGTGEVVARLDAEVEDELFDRLEELERRLGAVDARIEASVEAAAVATAAAERTAGALENVLVRMEALGTTSASAASAAAVADVADRVAATATPADVEQAVAGAATGAQAEAILERLLELAPAEQVGALLDAVQARFDALGATVASVEDIAEITAPLATEAQVEAIAGAVARAATAVQVEKLTSRATALQDALAARFAALHSQLDQLPSGAAEVTPLDIDPLVHEVKSVVVQLESMGVEQRVAVESAFGRMAADLAATVATVARRVDDVSHTMAHAREVAELGELVDTTAMTLGRRVDELHGVLRSAVTDQLAAVRDLVDLQAGRGPAAPAGAVADGAVERAVATISDRLTQVERAMTALARIVEDQVRAAGAAAGGTLSTRAADALTDRLAAVERDLAAVAKRLVTTDRLANTSDGLRATLTTFVATQLADLRSAVASRADLERVSEELRALAERLPAPEVRSRS